MKTKLLIEINDLEQGLDFIKKGYGSLLLNVIGVSLTKQFNCYTNEISILVSEAKKHDVEIYVNLDMLYHQEDLIGLRAILKKLHKLDITGLIINDVGLISMLKDLGLKFKLTNGSSTLNTNYMTINYSSKFYSGFFLSNEININEIIKIAANTDSSLMVQVYGRQKVFYSKRNLLSAYYNYNEMELIDFHPRNRLVISDITKQENKSYIYEDSFGTHIYTRDSVVGLKYIRELIDNNVEYLYLSNMFCLGDSYEKIVQLHYKYIHDESYKFEDAYNDLIAIDNNVSESFFNDKTVFTIEEARLLEKEQEHE